MQNIFTGWQTTEEFPTGPFEHEVHQGNKNVKHQDPNQQPEKRALHGKIGYQNKQGRIGGTTQAMGQQLVARIMV